MIFMKGMELNFLGGLIFLVVILLIIMLIVVNPMILFNQGTGTAISFREFCLHWSTSDYREGLTESVYIQSKDVPVKETCAKAMGIDPGSMNLENLENCKNLCRSKA